MFCQVTIPILGSLKADVVRRHHDHDCGKGSRFVEACEPALHTGTPTFFNKMIVPLPLRSTCTMLLILEAMRPRIAWTSEGFKTSLNTHTYMQMNMPTTHISTTVGCRSSAYCLAHSVPLHHFDCSMPKTAKKKEHVPLGWFVSLQKFLIRSFQDGDYSSKAKNKHTRAIFLLSSFD